MIKMHNRVVRVVLWRSDEINKEGKIRELGIW